MYILLKSVIGLLALFCSYKVDNITTIKTYFFPSLGIKVKMDSEDILGINKGNSVIPLLKSHKSVEGNTSGLQNT